MDIWSLMRDLIQSDEPMTLARNPMIQFGAGNRRYLGAELLPERLVDQNEFTEDKIEYFTVIANDGTRYSEPQLKEGSLLGSFEVRLGEVDIARQLTGRDFDAIKKVAVNNPEGAKRQLIGWMNTAVNLAMVEKAEVQRWQALCSASVPIKGLDGREYSVPLSNPAGHRVTVSGGSTGSPAGWYSPTYDPFVDIFAQKQLLSNKGYQVTRIIGDTQIVAVMANNPIVQARVGTLTVTSGTLTSRAGLASPAAINSYLTGNFGLPPIETYDLTYRDQLGSNFFKPQGSLVMVCSTGRNEMLETGNDATDFEINDTLGYYAIGTAVGEDIPGRVIRARASDMKPVGMDAQGFTTCFPVLTAPESVAVINVSKPT